MGRVSVMLEVANYEDVALARAGQISAADVRRERIEGIVDPDAMRLVLPIGILESLGLRDTGQIRIVHTEGSKAERAKVYWAFVEILGRRGAFSAIMRSDCKTAVIGSMILSELDLLIDHESNQLIPRDPNEQLTEVETVIA